jgi:hypothetical protein
VDTWLWLAIIVIMENNQVLMDNEDRTESYRVLDYSYSICVG